MPSSQTALLCAASGRCGVRIIIERGRFSPNTARLTACRVGDRVADSEKGGLNLFAITNGCTREEIREVLLQVAIYCGIPASLDAHNMVMEVFAEAK